MLVELGLPKPFAFNYHFDNDGNGELNFRGLAFANYNFKEEAEITLKALNGFDLLVSFISFYF